MHRRTFLHAASAPIGLAALDRVNLLRVPAPSVQGAAVHTTSRSSVVVIGAGAFGGWTALHLREMGHDVTLVDAYGPGNSRATSGDETRQIRCGYGDRLLYARSALRAMTAWREREQQFGVSLLNPTGRLQLAPAWTPSLKATQATLNTLGVPFETMTDGDLRKRYPQMNPDGMGVGLLEPGAMVIRAKQAMLAVSQAFVRAGGTLRVARVQPGTVEGGRMVDLRVDDGSRLAADAFVFACGPWLPKLFPGLVGSRIQVPGRDVLYFGLPAGDLRLAFPNFPNYSEERYYGFASIDGRGFKVCPTSGTTSFDPDVDERIISATEVRRARAYLAQRFPSLANQPITESRVCQLENTADEHFIIDRHPEMANVLLAGGGSGHGFKHGPVIGQYIAKRALGEPTDTDFDHMVRLAR
ncbi:FAD-binding oxidoreductase [Gemmatimonas sp.]|jgi:glycine/D-amino acid oxidase-like deaminating enzyme|uniref:FAD-binding oxidoreductase n=1 Tax=Gemmatimonas sp. TaxID=1962908 RepID=UPI0037C0C2D1